ncbi:ABC transporter permease subunit [Blastococcus sp. PRF04-17]|nr:ABC transporter permease subunit [Blastococcus sp. PRF04-17]UOY00416.1 ABC transporter permease subunit [Blastococcus sp. PRF04-17]
MSTTATATLPAAGSMARRTGPSFPALTGLEIRKSLSTRSGKAVAALAVGVGPLGVLLATLTSGGGVVAAIALGIMGMLIALVLLALGVLSTAGEWTHKSVERTYLLVPQRGRVLAAKATAMAVLGLVLAAVGVGLAVGTLAVVTPDVVWFAAGQAVIAVIASGAAFAVIGAGIGAAVGNSAAAMIATYLTVLGILPVVNSVKPEIAEKLDPASSIVTLAQHGAATTPIVVISAWVVISTIAGIVITRRRSVA